MCQFRKYLSLLLSILLLTSIFSACSKDSANKNLSEAYEFPTLDESLSGNLKIAYTLKSDSLGLYPLIKKFEEAYPNVNIEMDYHTDGSKNILNTSADELNAERDNFIQRILSEMHSSEGNDLIFGCANRINMINLTKSGALVDFNTFISQDDSFNLEDYFEKIIRAFEIDENLSSFPLAFSINAIALNTVITDALDMHITEKDDFNYSELLDLYDKAEENGIIDKTDTSLFCGDYGRHLFYEYERNQYMDFKNSKADFESNSFIEMLERTKLIPTERTDINDIQRGYDRFFFNTIIDATMNDKTSALIKYYEGEHDNLKNALLTSNSIIAMNAEELITSYENVSNAKFMTSTSGSRFISSSDTFVIPNVSKSKELAWTFIKFCISKQEEISSPDTSNIYADGYWSINKANSKKLIEYENENSLDELGDTFLVNNASTEEVIEYSFNLLDGDTEFEHLEMFNFIDMSEILNNYYYKSLITAEECANEINSKSNILLKE